MDDKYTPVDDEQEYLNQSRAASADISDISPDLEILCSPHSATTLKISEENLYLPSTSITLEVDGPQSQPSQCLQPVNVSGDSPPCEMKTKGLSSTVPLRLAYQQIIKTSLLVFFLLIVYLSPLHSEIDCFINWMMALGTNTPPHAALMINWDYLYYISPVGLRNSVDLQQALIVLPWAIIACMSISGVLIFIARQSRSRDIDWSDSHLFLEYDGPLTLAVKWAAVQTIEQTLQWEPFHGMQPAFIVTTRERNVHRMRLSDINKKHNIGAFFSLVKTNAPNAVLNVNPQFAQNNSYTELWLKYFSAPAEREKTGLLEKGMILDNGRYQIVSVVGGGGQGTAYLAVVNCQPTNCQNQSEPGASKIQHIVTANESNLSPMQQVLLKEYVLPVHRGQLTAERTAQKLKEESEILRRLNHPQIVRLEDALIEDYRGYLVLEYVDGETLKLLVERLGPQQDKQVIDWALQICSILDYMHGLSPPVVHRDITPDNLMLQENGLIKLVDFNVAYQVDSSSTASVVGKHAYIPAEQFRGKPTTQSDIYSLGGTLFFLLTGEEPEPISQSHPRKVISTVLPELNEIVAKATSSLLADRFATVSDMAIALRKLTR